MKIALATAKIHPLLHEEDRVLIPAFTTCGLHAEPAVWSDPNVNWASYGAVIIRSCWDYWENRAEFLRWADGLERQGILLFNSNSVLHWNTEKSYLRKFQQAGIPIPPTEWMEGGSTGSLPELMDRSQWDEVVVKPVVSAGAHRTFRVSRSEAMKCDVELNEILSKPQYGGAIVQPFMEEILSEGETSLIFFGGKLSHSLRKKGPDGEFRVQPQYGGTNVEITPTFELIQFAERILGLIPETLLYARVDVVETANGPVLMELELTEPNLFFGISVGAADRFVGAFQRMQGL